jgi:hypothetical protein
MRDRTPRLKALDNDQPARRRQPGISVGFSYANNDPGQYS